MKCKISIFTSVISLPNLLTLKYTQQPNDNFMKRSRLRDTFESVDNFGKCLKQIITKFCKFISKNLLKNFPNFWVFLNRAMFEKFIFLFDYVTNVNNLTILNKTRTTILYISEFQYDFLSDHKLSPLNQKISRRDNISKLRDNIIAIIDQDFLSRNRVEIVNRIRGHKLSLSLGI